MFQSGLPGRYVADTVFRGQVCKCGRKPRHLGCFPRRATIRRRNHARWRWPASRMAFVRTFVAELLDIPERAITVSHSGAIAAWALTLESIATGGAFGADSARLSCGRFRGVPAAMSPNINDPFQLIDNSLLYCRPVNHRHAGELCIAHRFREIASFHAVRIWSYNRFSVRLECPRRCFPQRFGGTVSAASGVGFAHYPRTE